MASKTSRRLAAVYSQTGSPDDQDKLMRALIREGVSSPHLLDVVATFEHQRVNANGYELSFAFRIGSTELAERIANYHAMTGRLMLMVPNAVRHELDESTAPTIMNVYVDPLSGQEIADRINEGRRGATVHRAFLRRDTMWLVDEDGAAVDD